MSLMQLAHGVLEMKGSPCSAHWKGPEMATMVPKKI